MGKADARDTRRRHRGVHPIRDIAAWVFRRQRGRQQHSLAIECIGHRFVEDDDVRRRPDARYLIPDAADPRRIVIAGHQQPRHIALFREPRQRTPDFDRGDQFRIEDVARDHDVLRALATRDVRDPRNGCRAAPPRVRPQAPVQNAGTAWRYANRMYG